MYSLWKCLQSVKCHQILVKVLSLHILASGELSQDVNFRDRWGADQVPFEQHFKAEEMVFQLGCFHHSGRKEQANVNVSIIIIAIWQLHGLSLKVRQSSLTYPFLCTPLIISHVKREENQSLCTLKPSALPYTSQQRWKEIPYMTEIFVNGDHNCNFIYGNF